MNKTTHASFEKNPRRLGPVALCGDALLLAAERLGRQVYWSVPRLRAFVQGWRARRVPPRQRANRRQFREYLQAIGVRQGQLVMAHTSVTGLEFDDDTHRESRVTNPAAVAAGVIEDLLSLIGPQGTLLMPSHAAYQSEVGGDLFEVRQASSVPLIQYDPEKTPCNVGLANELFRRRAGVLRSLHPRNTLAAYGPLATELLDNNLNEQKPLAHGIYSGYYRFCQKDGLVVSVGVPLGRYLTLVHVAEDVRDQQWLIPDFFAEGECRVRVAGQEREWVVRHRRPEYTMFCLCMRKLRRDLLREGILHEGSVGSVRVDWARGKEVFDYMMMRNERSPYPYYWPWLVRGCARRNPIF